MANESSTPEPKVVVEPVEVDLGHSVIDTRSGDLILATRGNIVSDGPGTIGHS